MESSCQTGSGAIFNDSMNTFSTTFQGSPPSSSSSSSFSHPIDASTTYAAHSVPVSTRITPLTPDAAVSGITTCPSQPTSSPSSPSPTAPSTSISSSSSPTATPQQPSPTSADSLPNAPTSFVHSQKSTSDASNNSSRDIISISNHNASTDNCDPNIESGGKITDNNTNDDTSTLSDSSLVHTLTTVHSSSSDSSQTCKVNNNTGGKALGFLGSFNPKGSRQRANKSSRKDLRPSSLSSLPSIAVPSTFETSIPPTIAQPSLLARRKSMSPACLASLEPHLADLSPDRTFPPGRLSKELQEPPPHRKFHGHHNEPTENTMIQESNNPHQA